MTPPDTAALNAWHALSLYHRRAFGILSDKFADRDQLESAQNHAQWADMIDDHLRALIAAPDTAGGCRVTPPPITAGAECATLLTTRRRKPMKPAVDNAIRELQRRGQIVEPDFPHFEGFPKCYVVNGRNGITEGQIISMAWGEAVPSFHVAAPDDFKPAPYAGQGMTLQDSMRSFDLMQNSFDPDCIGYMRWQEPK